MNLTSIEKQMLKEKDPLLAKQVESAEKVSELSPEAKKALTREQNRMIKILGKDRDILELALPVINLAEYYEQKNKGTDNFSEEEALKKVSEKSREERIHDQKTIDAHISSMTLGRPVEQILDEINAYSKRKGLNQKNASKEAIRASSWYDDNVRSLYEHNNKNDVINTYASEISLDDPDDKALKKSESMDDYIAKKFAKFQSKEEESPGRFAYPEREEEREKELTYWD